MKYVKGFFAVIVGLSTVLAFLYPVYISSIDKPSLSVTTLSTEHLTQLPKVNGLQAKYLFQGDTVADLWKVDVSIQNSGKETIIGRGEKKNILDDYVAISVDKPFKILSVDILSKTLPLDSSVLIRDNKDLVFKFSQWREDEIITCRVHLERQTSSENKPVLYINDRQIINGEIQYSQNINKKDLLIKDLFVAGFAKAARTFSITFLGILLIMSPVFIAIIMFRMISYEVWEYRYKKQYDKGVAKLVSEGVFKKYIDPRSASDAIWARLSMDKPFIPDNDWKIFILIFLIFGLGSFFGLIWIVPVFW